MSGEIFVVGASRSGTNLRARAAERAQHALGLGETHYFDDLRPRLPGDGTEPLAGDDARPLRALLPRALPPRLRPGRRPRARAASSATSYARWPRSSAGRATRTSRRSAGCARSATAASTGARRRRGTSTGSTICSTAFPEAKVVCLVRDPRAVVASYKDWHGAAERRGVTESPELEADRERTRRSYNPVLMSLLWRGVVRASFEALERHGPERVRIQRFERLAAAPEAEVRELCAWLGLDFEPALLEIPVVNSSYATDRRRRLERAGRALAGAALAAPRSGSCSRVCEPLLSELGYAPRRRQGLAAPRSAGPGERVPFAAARAAVVNRRRLGKATQYLAHARPRRLLARPALAGAPLRVDRLGLAPRVVRRLARDRCRRTPGARTSTSPDSASTRSRVSASQTERWPWPSATSASASSGVGRPGRRSSRKARSPA